MLKKNTHQEQFKTNDNTNNTIINDTQIDPSLLKELTSLQNDYDELVVQFGSVQMRQLLLDEETATLNLQYNKTRATETRIMETIKSKYGDVNIDMGKGMFIAK